MHQNVFAGIYALNNIYFSQVDSFTRMANTPILLVGVKYMSRNVLKLQIFLQSRGLVIAFKYSS